MIVSFTSWCHCEENNPSTFSDPCFGRYFCNSCRLFIPFESERDLVPVMLTKDEFVIVSKALQKEARA